MTPRVFWTSDTHFGHAAVIGYCNRPYASVEEMDRALVKNWNDVVGPRDTVYHLGDFCMGPKTNIAKYRRKLNGDIILVAGNHDRSRTAMLAGGMDAYFRELVLEPGLGVRIEMRHIPSYAPLVVGARVTYQFCGHVHGKWARLGNVINVGVDVQGYRPRTLTELLATAETPAGEDDDPA